MKDFRGKNVLVTGSASGIGRKLAIRLSKEGANLILTDVKEADLNDAAEEIRRGGGTANPYVLDVTDQEAVFSVRDKVHGDVGRLDVLVNNAGVVFGGPFLEVPLEKHVLTYKVNTIGLVMMTYAFLPDLIARSEGHLVNMASASGLIGLPNGATYASSKWSVIGFSESIRLELENMGHRHVKLTTACPSYIATGMFSGVRAPMFTPMLTPDLLVEKLVSGVKRDEVFVFAPPMVKTLPLLKGVLPLRAFDWVADRFGVSSSMKDWKGHDR